MFQNIVPDLIYIIPAVAVAFSLHEFAHSYTAYKMGDTSQKTSGRMSLNPLNHLDPIGTISLVLFGFGWAKPVQINPYNFHDRKNGMVWSAVAGPLMNFLVAFISVFLSVVLLKTEWAFSNSFTEYLYLFLYYSAIMNVGLGIFNLIPVPPLDGSKVLLGILNEETYFKILQYERYLSLALLVLLFTNVLDGPLMHARSTIINAFFNLSVALLKFL